HAAAYASAAPMLGNSVTRLSLPGRDTLPLFAGERGAYYNSVSPEFFAATGMRIVDGRPLLERDAAGAERVAVVSQSMARTYWPGQNPIGQCLIVGERTNPCTNVVGVAADVHTFRLIESPSLHYYLPATYADTVFSPRAL